MTYDLVPVFAAAADIPLEIFCGSPHFSLFAAMVFPDDREKAAIYVAHWLSKAIGWASDSMLVHAPISLDEHRWIHARASQWAKIAKEAERRAKRGTKAGAVVRNLSILGAGASWNDAIHVTRKGAEKSMARSAFFTTLSDFSPVLHYWGALRINYEGAPMPKDVPLFVRQALHLLLEMRGREAIPGAKIPGAKEKGLFLSPKIIVPVGAIDWRGAGWVRGEGVIDRLFLPGPKNVGGRPRKPQS